MGYFQYPTFYTVKCCVSDNKAAALIPGATHDRRAATERCPESADEIGSAARRGGHSGWRSSMMNEATDVRHVAVVFRLCLNVFPRPGNRSFTSPGVHSYVSILIRTGSAISSPAPKHSTMAAEGGRGGGDIVANTCTDAASSSSN